jgi:hypothetical protein
MAIKRYVANSDTTITNAYRANLTTRGSASNMGRADSLEVFSIYAQESSGSSELSRILIEFPISTISTDRSNAVIPASGSVSFVLRMFNAVTPNTVARNFTLVASAVSGNAAGLVWQEGNGIDMENYTDVTRDGIGANWMNYGSSSAAGLQQWNTAGGDYFTDLSSSFKQTFEIGTEDLEMDITTLVEQWVNSAGNVLGSKANYGLGVHLTASQEVYVATADATTVVPANTAGAKRSYYDKKFFARSSEFFFKRPYIEARWDSATKDDRGTIFYSSSLATADENLNTLYLYNYFRGQLRNIPRIGTGNIYVSIFSGSADNTAPDTTEVLKLVADGVHVRNAHRHVITGSYISKGIYSASFALTAASPPLTDMFDVWFSGSNTIANAYHAPMQFHTGSFDPKKISLSPQNPATRVVTSVTNLKPAYNSDETARFRVFTRQKDWSPTIYTRAVATVPPTIVESGSYAVHRVIDGVRAIEFGTGSLLHTQMSFDVSGSYFDLDMGLLEPGYAYALKFAFYNGSIGSWQEQPEEFKFRVEE